MTKWTCTSLTQITISFTGINCYLHDLRQYLLGTTSGIMDPWPLKMSPNSPRRISREVLAANFLGMVKWKYVTPLLWSSVKLGGWSESPSYICPPTHFRGRNSALDNSCLLGNQYNIPYLKQNMISYHKSRSTGNFPKVRLSSAVT